MLTYALEYCHRGWAVIPCSGKTPLVRWAEYSKKGVTEDLVTAWWKGNTDNIAILTGEVSDLVVVDIDPGRGDTAKVVRDLDKLGTLSVETGGGGKHYYFLHPGTPVKNQVGAGGVDIRGDGGYVIAPPSVHPATGRKYTWAHSAPPLPLPEWVLEINQKPAQEAADTWLSDLFSGKVQLGQRNDSVAKLAGYYAKKGIPSDVAVLMVQQWNKDLASPLSNDEIEVTVLSVYRTAGRNKGPESYPGLKMVPCQDFMRQNLGRQAKWLLEGWLPDETIGFVVAAPGSYKTWLMMDMAWSVATGALFLGTVKPARTGPVLLFQQEDYGPSIAERLATVSNTGFTVAGGAVELRGGDFDVPIYHHEDAALRLDNPAALKDLEELIKEIRPVLVICDPLYSIVSQEDHMARAIEHLFELKRLRNEYGVSFVIAAHSKKSRDKLNREGLLGSQLVNAFLESGWQLESKTEKSVLVRRHFKTAPPQEVVELGFQIDTEQGKYVVSSGEVDERELIQFIAGEDKGTTEGLTDTQKSYIDALPASTASLSKIMGRDRKTVRSMMRKLESSGLVRQEDGEWVRA